MGLIRARWTTNEPKEDKTILHVHPASEEAVKTVLAQSADGMDGRSNWIWIRLENGDLILGCYPQGETYMAVEEDAVFKE